MRCMASDDRAARVLFLGRHSPMIEMVLRLAVPAVHQPETSVWIVIALKPRSQFVGSAGRTGQLLEVDA